MSDWLAEVVVVLGESPGTHYLIMKKERSMPSQKPLETDTCGQETQLCVSKTIVVAVQCFQGTKSTSENTREESIKR